MTDHLAEARARVALALRDPLPETTISWLTATCFNAHPAMSDGSATATAYREGIRDGLTAAAHIARQEQP